MFQPFDIIFINSNHIVHSISSRYVIYSLFICFIFLSPCLIDIILILAFRRAELISLTACDKCPATVLTQLHIAVRIRKHKREAHLDHDEQGMEVPYDNRGIFR